MKVKVCGMTDPQNIAAVAGTGPDYMGFIFYPLSPRYVGNKPERSVFDSVPGNIIRVGVFVDEYPAKILTTAQHAGLQAVQLHGGETPEVCGKLRAEGLTVIRAIGIGCRDDMARSAQYAEAADYFLFDTATYRRGGSGLKFDWSIMDDYNSEKPFFLSGGIGTGDIENIRGLCNRGLFAVDINSRFELCPGIKDPDGIRFFIGEMKKTGI